LQSVLNLNYPQKKLEIIVVNDGSTDKTEQRVLDMKKKNNFIKLISHKNIGKGASLNRALKVAKGKFFVCLDADSYVHKDALLHLLPHFKDRKVACSLPLMKSKKPLNLLQKMQFTEYLVNIFYKKIMGFLHCIPVAPGPFSVFRKNVLIKLDGYEEDNLTEDLEMTLRLQKHNYKIIQDMKAEVYTTTPLNLKSFFKQRKRWYKGGFFNALKYKKMMFNPKYGDFGIMQLPLLIISGMIGISTVLVTLYTSLKPHVKNLLNLRLVDFDIWTFIQNIRFNFNILDLNFANLIVFLIMFSISILILNLSYKLTRENISKYGRTHIIFFLFFYFFMLGISWILLFPELFQKKQEW